MSEPIKLVCRNHCGKDRVLMLTVAADGSGKLLSPADGVLRISADRLAQFRDDLDLRIATNDFPGGLDSLVPRALTEPLEPVLMPEADAPSRNAILREADDWICREYSKREEGAERESVCILLGQVRRWLYRDAPAAFWRRAKSKSIDEILSHATSRVAGSP